MLNKSLIYLDAAATTPPLMEVVKRVSEIDSNYWGNPSSLHDVGLLANEELERSRSLLSLYLCCKAENIIFTSGATESIHLAILGSCMSQKVGKIVISTIEHPAVISAAKKLERFGWKLEFWPVDHQGLINVDMSNKILSEDTRFISIAYAQGEIGTIQPISEIASLCKERGIIIHTDATQIIGKTHIDFGSSNIDLISGCGHKFGGPKGVGFLINNLGDDIALEHLFGGGKQENSLRSGTQPISLISSMALALKLNLDTNYSKDFNCLYNYTNYLTDILRNKLSKIDSIQFTGHPTSRLRNHISFLATTNQGIPIQGRQLVRELNKLGICASSGSACNSGSTEDSNILTAIDVPKELRQSGIRFSLCSRLTKEQVNNVPLLLQQAIENLSLSK